MKHLFFVILALGLMVQEMPLEAQNIRETLKERKAVVKSTKKELESKVSKTVKKEAKRLSKEGWQVVPGHLPLEKQLEKLYSVQYEVDEDLNPKYILGEAQSIGENFDAAKFQAIELAKIDLAGQVESEIVGIVETNIGNEQLSPEQASSITSTVAGIKDIVSQKIGRVVTVMEIMRVLPNKNKEVRVMIAYNSKTAIEQAKQSIRDNMRDKSEELQRKLDNILDLK